MLKDYYKVRVSENVEAFEFDSTGPKGSIRKVVRYSEINLKGFTTILDLATWTNRQDISAT